MPLAWTLLMCPGGWDTVSLLLGPLPLALWTIFFLPLHPELSVARSNEKSLIQSELMHSESCVPLSPAVLPLLCVAGSCNSGTTLQRRMERDRDIVEGMRTAKSLRDRELVAKHTNSQLWRGIPLRCTLLPHTVYLCSCSLVPKCG